MIEMKYLFASLLFVISPITSSAQHQLTNAEITQIVQQALRTTFGEASMGTRNNTSDAVVSMDTATLHIRSRSRPQDVVTTVALSTLDVGMSLRASSKATAFRCPNENDGSHISPNCRFIANRTYVAVGYLQQLSADSVVIPVSVLTPSMSSSGGGAGFSIAPFNVGVLVTRGSDGRWTNGKIKYWVAGN